ncbi:MAG: hypothetical protein HKN93_03245 [Acidimicrobiia bacterium]|nr:hypothetical protein [Acidimicrobiia bacterium]
MTESAARAAARTEATHWAVVAGAWSRESWPSVYADLAPYEADVVGFFDPADDVRERAAKWQYPLESGDIGDLARFAAALAVAEADAWRDDHPHIATQAFEQRRFLVGDRMAHWAVPWLDNVGRCYPAARDAAHGARDTILRVGDHHRPAPVLVDEREGIHLPGHDSFGPVERDRPLEEWLGSVWSGMVILRPTLEGLTGERRDSRNVEPGELSKIGRELGILYEVTAARWRRMADTHPGTGRLWLDLGDRAEQTSTELLFL